MPSTNETTIYHLYSIANYLDSVSPASKNITRLLREKCTLGKDECGHNLRLPRHLFGRNTLCPKCLTPWSKGLYKLKIKPLKVLNTSRKATLNRLLAKNESHLNRFQSSLAERLKSNGRNLIILTCLECKKVSKISMPKTKSTSYNKIEEQKVKTTCSPVQVNEVKKKRKKKKKDSLCGLKLSAVAQVRSMKDVSSGSNKPSTDMLDVKSNLNPRFCSKSYSGKTSFSVLNDKVGSENIKSNEKCKTVLFEALPFEGSTNISKYCENERETLNLKYNEKCLPFKKPLISDLISKMEPEISISSKQKTTDYIIQQNIKESKETSPDSLILSESKAFANFLEDNSNNSHFVEMKNSTTHTDIDSFNSEASLNSNGFQFSTSEVNLDSVKPGNISSKLTKVNLFSQPSINKIQNNHKNDKHCDKTKSINKICSPDKNPKGKKFLNDKGKSKSSNSNNSSLSVNSKKQKKVKNKSKSKTSFLKKEYRVFENANCQNSLCVKDLLSLT